MADVAPFLSIAPAGATLVVGLLVGAWTNGSPAALRLRRVKQEAEAAEALPEGLAKVALQGLAEDRATEYILKRLGDGWGWRRHVLQAVMTAVLAGGLVSLTHAPREDIRANRSGFTVLFVLYCVTLIFLLVQWILAIGRPPSSYVALAEQDRLRLRRLAHTSPSRYARFMGRVRSGWHPKA